MRQEQAEMLVIAALREWFGDRDGFNRDTPNRRRAVKAVALILKNQEEEGVKNR